MSRSATRSSRSRRGRRGGGVGFWGGAPEEGPFRRSARVGFAGSGAGEYWDFLGSTLVMTVCAADVPRGNRRVTRSAVVLGRFPTAEETPSGVDRQRPRRGWRSPLLLLVAALSAAFSGPRLRAQRPLLVRSVGGLRLVLVLDRRSADHGPSVAFVDARIVARPPARGTQKAGRRYESGAAGAPSNLRRALVPRPMGSGSVLRSRAQDPRPPLRGHRETIRCPSASGREPAEGSTEPRLHPYESDRAAA